MFNVVTWALTLCVVHWRFEESLCKDHQLGLCFLRCGDGSVIDSGLHPVIKNLNMTYAFLQKESCPRDGARGVLVSKVDLIEAIYAKSIKENVSIIYLATDGWMRGPTQQALVKEVTALCISKHNVMLCVHVSYHLLDNFF